MSDSQFRLTIEVCFSFLHHSVLMPAIPHDSYSRKIKICVFSDRLAAPQTAFADTVPGSHIRPTPRSRWSYRIAMTTNVEWGGACVLDRLRVRPGLGPGQRLPDRPPAQPRGKVNDPVLLVTAQLVQARLGKRLLCMDWKWLFRVRFTCSRRKKA